jgi:hypothetical protein
MGAENKKPENTPEPQSGFPQKKMVYAILAIAVVILAVILIAKFSYNVDLLTPSSGEMSLVKRQITSAPPVNVQKEIKTGNSFRPDVQTLQQVTTAISCSPPKTLCGGTCVDIATDTGNCGVCGNDCSTLDRKNVAEFGCTNAKCTIKTCQPGYGDCTNLGTADINGDGCETNFKDGSSWFGSQNDTYVTQEKDPSKKMYPEEPLSCGSCWNHCTGDSSYFGICDNGACRQVCWGSLLNCDNTMSNGCEQVFNNSNCGACGAKCPADSICSHGCCVSGPAQTQVVADSLGVKCSGNTWDRV